MNKAREFIKEHPSLNGKVYTQNRVTTYSTIKDIHETQLDKQKVKEGFDKVACEGRLCEDCCHDSSCGFQDLRKEIGLNTSNTEQTKED